MAISFCARPVIVETKPPAKVKRPRNSFGAAPLLGVAPAHIRRRLYAKVLLAHRAECLIFTGGLAGGNLFPPQPHDINCYGQLPGTEVPLFSLMRPISRSEEHT